MLTLAVIFYSVASLGAVAVGLKYLLSGAPMPHHADILSGDGVTAGLGLSVMLGALYRIVGGACIGVALAVMLLALGLTETAPLGVKVGPALVGLFLGVPATLMPRMVENTTGVRTPWRAPAVLSALLLLAFILSLL